jgi:hypothetical protein
MLKGETEKKIKIKTMKRNKDLSKPTNPATMNIGLR